MPTYIRVRDPETKHEWDEPEGSALIRRGRVTPIKADRYPPVTIPRPPKHYLAPKRPGKPTPAGEGTTTKKENTDG